MSEPLPIDPTECTFDFKRVTEGYATLDIRIPSKFVRRVRNQMRVTSTPEAARALRSVLIQYSLERALKDQPVRLVTQPGLAEDSATPETAEFHDFECRLGLDFAVNISIPDMEKVELTLPDATVTEELIEAEVRSQCIQFGARASAAAVSRGCACVLDLEYRVEASEPPVLALAKAEVLVPAVGDFLVAHGQQLVGIIENIAGARAGETRSFDGVFPATFAVPFLRGRRAHVTARIHSIQTIAPAAIESVLKEYGMPSAERLRTQIRFALEDKRARDCQVLLREQMSELLPDLVKVEAPRIRARLLRAQAQAQFLTVLKARGITGERASKEWETHKASIDSRADHQARLKLILPSFTSQLSMVIDEDTVTGRLASIAAERGLRPEQVRADLVQSGRYQEFLEELAGDAVLDRLIGLARTRSVSDAEWTAAQRARHLAPQPDDR